MAWFFFGGAYISRTEISCIGFLPRTCACHFRTWAQSTHDETGLPRYKKPMLFWCWTKTSRQAWPITLQFQRRQIHQASLYFLLPEHVVHSLCELEWAETRTYSTQSQSISKVRIGAVVTISRGFIRLSKQNIFKITSRFVKAKQTSSVLMTLLNFALAGHWGPNLAFLFTFWSSNFR